ncbi:hypothetical protein QNO08_02970 [Arthrobacter sp. zg-Y820]|uniref:hypothetical protein n=1 Tax=unclassified Arthrobacter TaxID=235627 RepID=UPI001E4AC836|nr:MULTISPECIES: hypothetical protein [unclassified Arthrobacter]MCC9195295.1 hypothetical protein [Arthrobacter sp. zg-Y820]MDK1278154.1 hypothetical protein [Arthrobacter sp. zg.Y820]WIB10041.1 hypothetical protein QNO08_02970 [Arthrobacter sp. zg-Y820]
MSEPTQPSIQPGPNPGPWNQGQPGQQGTGGYPAPGAPSGYSYPAPAGQPQGGYGYPQSPAGQMVPAQEPARPQQVNLAFWLLIGSAVLGLIALPFAIAYVNSPEYLETMEETFRNAGLQVDSTTLAASVASGTASAAVSGIIGLGVRVALAFLVRAGFNWARITITVFAALSLIGLFGLFTAGTMSGFLTLAAMLATFAAVVLLFMKPSSEYFARKKAYRQAQKFGGY